MMIYIKPKNCPLSDKFCEVLNTKNTQFTDDPAKYADGEFQNFISVCAGCSCVCNERTCKIGGDSLEIYV